MSEKMRNFSGDPLAWRDDFLKDAGAAVSGLVYISETDAPLTPFVWEIDGPSTDDVIRRQSDAAPGTPVATMPVESFFAPLTRIYDGYGDVQKARAARFAQLLEMLDRELTDIAVYRIGSIQVDIYVVGTGACGWLAGVSTRAVET